MKNKKNTIFIISITILFLVSLLSSLLIINYHNKKVMLDTNKRISLIMNKDISNEDKINIINTSDDILLEKFGINIEKDYVLVSNKKEDSKLLLFISINILITFMLLTIILFIYNKKSNKEIKDITKLIENINNKIYSIDILSQNEGEISILKSEIYKTILMLKVDAEESKKKESALLDSIADISHQLKTPLTSISITLDNILDNDKMKKEEINKFLYLVQRQITDMNNLIVMLLQLSRFDADVVEFKKDNIKLLDLLNDIKDKLEVNLDIKNISLNIECDKDIKIIGDKKWEREAILNIVKNAIDHSRESSSVDVSVMTNEFYTKVIIKDNGDGINPKDIKHIFDRFYKSSNSKGFGIGLNLAKTIVEKDNGYITVSSSNNGTTFEIKYMNN